MRALLLVLDGLGVGHAPDAHLFGDHGANTLEAVYRDAPGFALPCLERLGLTSVLNLDTRGSAEACYGWMEEMSIGKDSTTGHWELAGVISGEPFPCYSVFPPDLIRQMEEATGMKFLGNVAREASEVLQDFGAQHLRTGRPIVYTGSDSVMQIAAHENVLPRDRLYELCDRARQVCNAYRVGRVIARPFAGERGRFANTGGRKDYALPPPPTALDRLKHHGVEVTGVGKVADLFAGEGLANSFPTSSAFEGMETVDELWAGLEHGLIFANLLDFDGAHGPRRDAVSYGRALTEFDDWFGRFRESVLPEDLVILTADHGSDPTRQGAGHTRERVPLIMLHREQRHCLGLRRSFADAASTLTEFFRVPRWPRGHSFLDLLT